MRIKAGIALLCCAAGPLFAETPLSAIDWLDDTPTVKAALPAVSAPQKDEPKTATTATRPSVSVAPLGTAAPQTSGLIPQSVTGLPADLWEGSDVRSVTARLRRLPDIDVPALQSLLFSMMLTETNPLSDPKATDQLLTARVAHLTRQGALDPALDLLAQSGAFAKPAHAQTWFDLSLLAGQSDGACAAVASGRSAVKDYGARIYCLARTGAWEDAALLLGSGSALGLISDYDAQLLTHFLDPELAEDDPLGPTPQSPTPLQFTILGALGEPVPTASLPRLYANTDLGDQAGWKAELRAAERLSKAGALPANRLLGIYSEREPAASGGIWDRVDALQRFETALRTGSADAVSKTLPKAWTEMKSAGLGASFAQLFADDLAKLKLDGSAARIAFDVALVSQGFKTHAKGMTPQNATQSFYADIATGTVTSGTQPSAIAKAVHDAFATDDPTNPTTQAATDLSQGTALLMAISRIHDGANGDLESLTVGLAALKALGREEDARRAALHVLILGED
jgi:hypothetical protein